MQTKPRLDLYEEKFERKFLKETSDFYNEQAKKYLDNGEVGWYMTQVLQGLDLNIFLFFFVTKNDKVAFFKIIFSRGSLSAVIFEDINKRFFATNRKMNNLELGRDRFFDFDNGHVTEAGKVENRRFLENC